MTGLSHAARMEAAVIEAALKLVAVIGFEEAGLRPLVPFDEDEVPAIALRCTRSALELLTIVSGLMDQDADPTDGGAISVEEGLALMMRKATNEETKGCD